ncbi:MAG: TIGR02757 family protein [Paramuribaculum sp.]
MISSDLRLLLDSEAARINNPAFIDLDPVQFPRRFTALPDIEIAALLCSSIAWGNRKMICRNCDRMLALMGHDPYNYVMDRAYEDLPDGNIHRTFFASNLRHFLRGLHTIYSRFGSLNDFARHHRIGDDEFPSWRLVELINGELCTANEGRTDSRCLPLNLQQTALKRVNMALRWLVRNDGIVDIGVWDAITPAQLYIPLDVHVGDTARNLGLVTRKANDRRTTVELTQMLRTLRPDDPVIYDYALFGIGIML